MIRATLIASLLLTGCTPATRVGPGELADAGTTAIGLASGLAVEGNPLVTWAGDAAIFVGLALKVGIRQILVAAGEAPRVAYQASQTLGWGGACANVATLSGAVPQAAIIVGIACAAVYRDATR